MIDGFINEYLWHLKTTDIRTQKPSEVWRQIQIKVKTYNTKEKCRDEEESQGQTKTSEVGMHSPRKPSQERYSTERLAASNSLKRCSQMERPLGLAAMRPLVSSIQQCQQKEEPGRFHFSEKWRYT